MEKILKILITMEGDKFYVRNPNSDLHTQYGFVKADDIKKAKNGAKLMSNTGKEFFVFEPGFIDCFRKIKRAPQTVSLKDIGIIVAETGINKKSKVVDAGTGSGALACFLANIVKEVTSYELREDFYEIAKQNKEFLNLNNLKIKNKDIYKKIDERNVNLITLDLPEPWEAVPNAEKALRHGGFLVSYSPTIPQAMDFLNAIKKSSMLIHLKTIEIIEREWEVDERRVRPKTRGTYHTGFLTFIRKV